MTRKAPCWPAPTPDDRPGPLRDPRLQGPAARRRHVRGKPQRRSRLRHLPVSLDESAQMRHAYFVYFPAWKWVLAISDSSQAIIDKVAAQKANMIAAIDRNLSELRLSRHGFVFVVADDGTVIVPPPHRPPGCWTRQTSNRDGYCIRCLPKSRLPAA